MNSKITRRDFLKLASTLPPVLSLPPSVLRSTEDQTAAPNILVVLFDAWSAHNISLYGYPRRTTPNLEQLAEKAIVYHNHYAGGHFTVPGTASLLTGALPWRHNIYHERFKLKEDYQQTNLFGLFPDYRRFAYTHNLLAEDIIRQMRDSLDTIKPWQDLYYWKVPIQRMFLEDSDTSSLSWIRSMEMSENGFANSLFFSRVWSHLTQQSAQDLADTYPLGLPKFSSSYAFILEEAIDWLSVQISGNSEPQITYYHLLPPHDPYNTRVDFFQQFTGDGFTPSPKPEHFLTQGINDPDNLANRTAYDEFILLVDSEIRRLFNQLASKGVLENTWVVLTSDHGEIFERGLRTHDRPSFFEPLARVPLLIFPPGQQNRVDIHTPTSAVDILPTLLSITGKPIPAAVEGKVLPPFGQEDPNRSIFQIDSQFSGFKLPDPTGSIMVRKGSHKLICHFGNAQYYEVLQGEPVFELYNLEEDPEELVNLFPEEINIASQLLDEINAKLASEAIDLQIHFPANPAKN